MIKRLKSKDAADVLGINEHVLKPLREAGFLVGTKVGRGYMYDTEELEEFIRLTRGYDLSNEYHIQQAARIIHPMEKMPHPGKRGGNLSDFGKSNSLYQEEK